MTWSRISIASCPCRAHFPADRGSTPLNEQHASHRLLDAILGFGSGVADILANEIVARDAHHLLASNVAEAMQDLRHSAGDRGLARARMAGKAHVQGGRIGLKPHHLSRSLDLVVGIVDSPATAAASSGSSPSCGVMRNTASA